MYPNKCLLEKKTQKLSRRCVPIQGYNELKDGLTNTGSSGSVANDELFKLHETSGLVDFVCTSSTSFTTAFCKDFAASVRNII